MPPEGQGGLFTLDLARITGWAYGPLHWNAPWFGDWHLPFEGGEGCRFAAFENELTDALAEFRPASLILEAPINLPAMTNRAAMWQQLGLRAIARCNAWRENVPVSEVSADTVRVEVLGLSRVPGHPDAIKRHVEYWCRRKMGWKVPSHNAGDACVLWEWGRRRHTGSMRVQGALFAAGAGQ
jgi:hypothetical protein